MTDHIPVVETTRLRLRAPKLDDLPQIAAFFASDRSTYVGGPVDELGSFSKLTARIGHWALMGFGLWHIETRENGAMVGWAGIVNPPSWDEPELGWTVFESAEGQGIAYEAASAARDFSARQLGLDGVISYIAPSNTRSAALASRLGARHERDGALMGTACQIYRHPTLQEAV